MKGLLATLFVLLLNCPGPLHAAEPVELRKGDVVAFVGGTGLVRMQNAGRFEAALTDRFRDAAPRFRDLAWEGDTVYHQGTIRERWRKGAFGAWKNQLDRVGATVVMVQFGKIESLDGPDRLGEFIAGYGKLLDELAAGGRRIILLAPGSFEWPEVQSPALPEYTRAVEQLAKRRNFPFLSGTVIEAIAAKAPADLAAAVQEKHRLWYEYWRPSNWKCLFGDDSRRIFSNAAQGLPSFKEEWKTYLPLIEAAEAKLLKGEALKPAPPPKRTGSPDADIAKERAAFDVLDGFEVNLFADETHGVANPLSLRWDPSGTMYVACSDTYPQVEPGVKADDRIIALKDTDGDGKADQSTVFARGLNIPTGMEVDGDTVYVGHGTELHALRDTDGDGVADQRKLLLSGFGNGDSHQTINSFVWSPDGELWFCQGDGIESRVETPFGVSSLFQAGAFRLRPRELQLDGLLDDFMGPGNPWGIAFDDFGQSFIIDGAGGVSFLTPASIPAKRRLRLPRIGNPGGYCGIDCLSTFGLPDGMHGDFVIGDYKKNQVSRFAVGDDGAGFKVKWKQPLLRSKHRNFRPIDVKLGPDGAIYVVDWYNPITCHQDDFYRHPARDKTHGRIWRVSVKGREKEFRDLAREDSDSLLKALQSPDRWTRMKAKQVLATRDPSDTAGKIRAWAKTKSGFSLMEAAAAMAWIGAPDAELVQRLLREPQPTVRAYGARLAGRWGSRLGNLYELLETAARDPEPRVRMEAVLAAGTLPDPRSITIAASVAEHPRDRWVDYAFSQAVHHLKPQWEPAFLKGELDFGDRRSGLVEVLGKANSKGLLDQVRKRLREGTLEGASREGLVRTLISVGEEADLKFALEGKPGAGLLRALASRSKPGFEADAPIARALGSTDQELRAAAFELAGRWRVGSVRDQAVKAAGPGSDPKVRKAAIGALGTLGGEPGEQVLKSILKRKGDPEQGAAVGALMALDPQAATGGAAQVLAASESDAVIQDVFAAVMSRKGAATFLAGYLTSLQLGPDRAERLRRAWVASGLVDDEMTGRLNQLAGFKQAGPAFSDALARELAAAGKAGDAARGRALFESPRLGCVACHQVGGKGGIIGPDLSALGSGTPPERIATEVMWPKHQVKEGYSLAKLTMKDGRVVQGYLQAGRDQSKILLRDFAGGDIREYPRDELAGQETIGSLMPPTAQALSRAELGDLLGYLIGLDGKTE